MPLDPSRERLRNARILLRKLPMALSVQRRHVLLGILRQALRGDPLGALRTLRSTVDRVLQRAHPRPPVDLWEAAQLFLPSAPPFEVLPEPVDVVIPVHDGLDVLPALFESLEREGAGPHRLIVVDDASPDPAVLPWLEQRLERHPGARLIRLERNHGFAGAANRGARETRGHFVLLNSDTRVPPGWLPRLLAPIRRDPSVASATPFTNSGTICSFPEMNRDNAPLLGLSTEAIDRAFRRVDPEAREIALPTAIGFCMAISRDAYQRIGLFDEEAFAAGYGEENDWSRRAIAAGFRHVMATNLYVHHEHSASYGAEQRLARMEKSLQEVVRRHPDYLSEVARFAAEDPAQPIRAFARLIAMGEASSEPPILVVDHDGGGGADLYREHEIDRPARERGRAVLRVVYDIASVGWRLEAWLGDHRIELGLASADELLLPAHGLALGEVFVNSVVTHEDPVGVLAAAREIASSSGARLTVAMHDYYALCPAYTLLDDRGRFCDLPAAVRCRRCLPANRFAAPQPGLDLKGWRDAWNGILANADRVLCFSDHSRQLVERVHPQCTDRIEVRPHTLPPLPDGDRWTDPRATPGTAPDPTLHIGVVGALNEQKGLKLLAEMAAIIQREGRKIDITVLGNTELDPGEARLRITGRYARHDLPRLLREHRIDVCFLPSIWPETFSYVAAELEHLGAPLCCFDLGAPAERLRDHPRARILERIDATSALDGIEAFWRETQAQTRSS